MTACNTVEPSYTETVKIEKGNTLLIAHRGLSKLEVENTIPTFSLAAEHSYYGIETDIRKSKDGTFFAIHDADTSRISKENIIISESTTEQIRQVELLDMSGNVSANYKIPTLTEFIQICKTKNKIAIVELKDLFSAGDIMTICDLIKDEEYLQSTIFISFRLENLLTLREQHPNQPAQYLISSYSNDLVEILVENNLDLAIHYKEITKTRVNKLHDKSIKINVWTVDSPKDAKTFVNLGVDYITTNILE